MPAERGLVVRWSTPAPVDGADVRARRAAGRLASRVALGEAIAAWRAAFGDGEWQRAPAAPSRKKSLMQSRRPDFCRGNEK
ncbi:MAG: hypothetical protein ACKORL_07610, partial [Phycisphaerales bacterium]